jgi:hypothetical protein
VLITRERIEEWEYFRKSFRDVAHHDYIAARALYRVGLMPQFMWAALQSIEKYLKAILLFSSKGHIKDIKHRLVYALARVEKETGLPLVLSKDTRDLLVHLDRFGSDRYFEKPYFFVGRELPDLDRAVWEIRAFCQPFDVHLPDKDGRPPFDYGAWRLDQAKKAVVTPTMRFRMDHGVLENIVDSKGNELRPWLVWKNLFWGKRKKARGASYLARSGSANPPSFLFTGSFPRLEKRIAFSAEVKAMFHTAGNAVTTAKKP